MCVNVPCFPSLAGNVLFDSYCLFSMLPKVIMDEQTLDVLVNYTTSALKVCSTWTHSDILLALSTIVYGNGPQCHQVDICTSFVNMYCGM